MVGFLVSGICRPPRRLALLAPIVREIRLLLGLDDLYPALCNDLADQLLHLAEPRLEKSIHLLLIGNVESLVFHLFLENNVVGLARGGVGSPDVPLHRRASLLGGGQLEVLDRPLPVEAVRAYDAALVCWRRRQDYCRIAIEAHGLRGAERVRLLWWSRSLMDTRIIVVVVIAVRIRPVPAVNVPIVPVVVVLHVPVNVHPVRMVMIRRLIVFVVVIVVRLPLHIPLHRGSGHGNLGRFFADVFWQPSAEMVLKSVGAV